MDADQGTPITTDTYAHDGGKMRPQLELRIQVRCGKFWGGKVWLTLDIEKLKNFMEISIYMGIKKVPMCGPFGKKKPFPMVYFHFRHHDMI